MITGTGGPHPIGRDLREQATGVGAAIVMLVAALLPLCINPWGYNAFELPKAALLRLLAGVAVVAVTAAGIASAMSSQGRWRKPPAWFLACLVMGSVLALATLLSTNRFVSLWGSYQRQQGFFTQAAYLGIFLVAVVSLNTDRRLERMWVALVCGSVPVVAYALLQRAGMDPFHWQIDRGSSVVSTVGRSNFLGSYLVLVIPLTVALGIAQDPQRLLRRLLWGVLLAGQAIILVLTSARSAWIGFAAAGLTTLLLCMSTRRPGLELRRRHLVLPICLLCAALLLAIVLGFRQLASEADLVLPRPLQSLFDVTSGSTAARIAIWEAVVKLIEERPLLGFGPERLDPIFWRVFPPQLVYYQGREFLVDRAHNLWLDLAIDTGLVGVVAFALMCMVWGRTAWRGLAASRSPKTRLVLIGLIAAVVGHLVDMQFSFEVTTTAAVFWLLIAGGFALAKLDEPSLPILVEAARVNGRLRQMTPSVLLAAALVSSTIVLGYLSLRFVQADLSFRHAYDERLALNDRRQQTIRAIQLWPMQWSYRIKQVALEVQRQDFRSAEAQLTAVDYLVGDDPELWRLQADLFAQWEDVDRLQQGKTVQAYQRMIRLAPNVARYHEGLGLVLARRGALEQAVKELEQTLNLDATDVSAYRNLTIFYRALGRNEEADSSALQAQYWAKRTTE